MEEKPKYKEYDVEDFLRTWGKNLSPQELEDLRKEFLKSLETTRATKPIPAPPKTLPEEKK